MSVDLELAPKRKRPAGERCCEPIVYPDVQREHAARMATVAKALGDPIRLQLVEEFEAVRSPEEIRACADLILGEYDGAPVRSFVLQLAHRRTRDCLRAEVCEPLALV